MFWMEIGIFIIGLISAMWILKFLLKKIFNIEQEKWRAFSTSHVNEIHRKVEDVLRWVSLAANLIVLYYFIFEELSIIYYIGTIVLFKFLDYFVQAFFIIKYLENPKESILTLSELALLALVLAAVIQFDVFELLV